MWGNGEPFWLAVFTLSWYYNASAKSFGLLCHDCDEPIKAMPTMNTLFVTVEYGSYYLIFGSMVY